MLDCSCLDHRKTLESLLVTLDITSLYTNIPREESLEACRKVLNTRGVLNPPTHDVINLINRVLKRKIHTIYKSMELQWGPERHPPMHRPRKNQHLGVDTYMTSSLFGQMEWNICTLLKLYIRIIERLSSLPSGLLSM